jgi:hypothetical protein
MYKDRASSRVDVSVRAMIAATDKPAPCVIRNLSESRRCREMATTIGFLRPFVSPLKILARFVAQSGKTQAGFGITCAPDARAEAPADVAVEHPKGGTT